MRHFHPQYAISTINGPRITREQALVAHSVLLPRAFQFFDSVMNLSSIGELFVRQEQNPKWGNIFTTPQVALAYAFYLAKTGREAKARAYMSEWLKGDPLIAERKRTLGCLCCSRKRFGCLLFMQ